jgi:hypothetical protein
VKLDPDIPLNTLALGRDLVLKLTEGRLGHPEKDGKYANVVGKNGKRYRVFTQVLPANPNSGKYGHSSCVNPSELFPIGFSQESDKPDLIAFVVINPVTESVEVFNYPVDRKSIAAYYSSRTGTFGKAEPYNVFSYK